MSRFVLFRLLFIACLVPASSMAQKLDTVATYSASVYVDAYYAYYTDSVGQGNFQKFPTVSPRSNSVGLNTAQLGFQYNGDRIRGAAVFHYGDIQASTWSATYPYIMEAHVGLKLLKTLWLDAGFFRTHFGTEFLLPVENITSSVAVGTYYEPYYESGLKLNFDPTAKLEINLFLLNGYNTFQENNNRKSFGMGITYALGDNGGIGYTNYIGDDSPEGDSVSHLRFANNIFLNYQYHKIKLQIGGDLITQHNSDILTRHKTATMYSALATVAYRFVPKASVYGRGEIFQDPDGYMSAVFIDKAGRFTGYKLWGITAGLEWKPIDNGYIRIEGRRLQMDKNQEIFNYDGQPRNYRLELMVNMGVTMDVLKGVRTKSL